MYLLNSSAIGILFFFWVIQWAVIYAMHERIADLEYAIRFRNQPPSYPQAQPRTLGNQDRRGQQAVSGSDQAGHGKSG